MSTPAAVDPAAAAVAVLSVVLGASVVGLAVLVVRLLARRRESARLRQQEAETTTETPAPARHGARRIRTPEDPADWRAADRQQILDITDVQGTATFLCSAVAVPGGLTEDERERLLAAHESLLRVHAERHRGRVVRPLGDGFLAVFADGSDAVRAAFGIRRDLAATGARRFGGTEVAVRIGVHAGPVVEHDAAVAGRVGSYAAAGEVLASEAVVQEIRDDPRFTQVPAGAIELDSFLGTHALWRILPKPGSTDPRRSEPNQTGDLARQSADGGPAARRGATTQPGRPDGAAQQPRDR